MRKLRERIRISQQLLCDMEKDMRAMRYAQIAAKMKKRSLEVTDDLLDTFIQFAGNHRGYCSKSRTPSASPAAAPAEESPEEESDLFPHAPAGKPSSRVPWSST